MIKVVLQGRIYLNKESDDVYPMIELSDEVGNVVIGHLTYVSVEQLARQYQKDNEYHNPDKGQYQYFLQYKGNKSMVQLFQKVIPQNYGEPNTLVDETNNY